MTEQVSLATYHKVTGMYHHVIAWLQVFLKVAVKTMLLLVVLVGACCNVFTRRYMVRTRDHVTACMIACARRVSRVDRV